LTRQAPALFDHPVAERTRRARAVAHAIEL